MSKRLETVCVQHLDDPSQVMHINKADYDANPSRYKTARPPVEKKQPKAKAEGKDESAKDA